ncbi:MAG TPA: helix-turn-helix domain-containing protein [Gaiellaceae bacterium]|jgi:transcriptional regulator with XRE-family HTH domain
MTESQTAAAQPAAPGDDSLGSRLRAERERRGLALRELARRLEVSPSLVSQIETGKTQPSVRTLYAIVSELGVSFDELFAPPGGEGQLAKEAPPTEAEGAHAGYGRVQREDDRAVIDLGSGVRWERLTTWNDRDVDFLCAIYEAGGSSSPDGSLMRHQGREFGVVLTGELGVKVGFEDYVLGPGDSIAFDSSIPHRLHNDGSEVVTAIWIVLGRHRPDGVPAEDPPFSSS